MKLEMIVLVGMIVLVETSAGNERRACDAMAALVLN
jgi:hypothetical protein